jgi:hypothetical protein
MKLTPEEQLALEKFQKDHPHSTVLKDERTARYLQSQSLREQGLVPVKPSDIKREALRQERYGRADWEQFHDVAATQPSAALWDSLQQFVQLSDTANVGDFAARYPGFLPSSIYHAERHPETGLAAWKIWCNLLREAWRSGFHPTYVAQLVTLATPASNSFFEPQPVCDAQRAVLWMMLESWRARFCPRCGTPFVARKPRDTYWPNQCFDDKRREGQRASRRKRYRRRLKNSRTRGRKGKQ